MSYTSDFPLFTLHFTPNLLFLALVLLAIASP